VPVAAAVGAPLTILVGDAAFSVGLLLLVAAHSSVDSSVEVVAEATAHQQPVPGHRRHHDHFLVALSVVLVAAAVAALGILVVGVFLFSVGLLLLVAVYFPADVAPPFAVEEATAHRQ